MMYFPFIKDTSKIISTFFSSTLVCLIMLLPALALAEIGPKGYPNKTIRMVIPFAAGGPTDVVARLLIQKLSVSMGQALILDNRGGGGAVLGTEIVAKAEPDGYTWLVSTGSMTSISAFNPNVPFDPIKDFAPVTMVARNYGQLLTVSPKLPVQSVSELLTLAKAQPGKLNYGSAGIGNITYIAAEMMKAKTGVNITDVQYKGTAPAVTDLLGSHLDLCFVPTQIVLPLVLEGKLKALAITGPTRWKALPNVPTMEEAGVKGYELIGYFGIWLPAKTSPDIVNYIHSEVLKALDDPELKKHFEEAGLVGVGSKPADFAKFAEKDTQEMKELAKKIGLSAK